MITTSGFKLSNLARYTPVDPNLVSFQPTKITEGALDAIRLAGNLQKYQSDRMKQEEEKALQQQRMEAARAAYGAQTASSLETMALAPVRTQDALAQFSAAAELRPGETALRKASTQSKSADLAFNEAIRNDVEAAKKVEAQTSAATAGMSAANKVQQLQLQAAELNDAIINSPQDKELQRKAKEVDVKYKEALSEQAKAAAKLSLEKPDIEREKIAQKKAAAEDLAKLAKDARAAATATASTASRRGSMLVEDPQKPGGALVPLSSIQGRLFEQDKAGNWVVKKEFLGRKPISIPPQLQQQLNAYQQLMQTEKRLLEEADALDAEVYGARKSAVKSQSNEPEIAKQEEASTGSQSTKIRLVMKPDGTFAPKQ